MDTGRAYSGFFFHRLLCRVFSDPSSRFLLKGGQSVLARTVDARTTRDIDLLSMSGGLEEAVEDLKRLSAVDLGDFVTFSFAEMKPIKTEDEYRSGANVRFHVHLGNKKLQDISIDLVVDDIPQTHFETLVPADRIEVRDISTCAYRVYPVESSLADKLCAIMERYQGRPSSRLKDLIDIVIYARSCTVDGSELSHRLRLECRARKMPLPGRFEVPSEWLEMGEARFKKLCKSAPLMADVEGIAAASAIAANLFDPPLSGLVQNRTWDPKVENWE